MRGVLATGVEGSGPPPVERRPERPTAGLGGVPAAWLAEFEGAEADDLDRLAVDLSLYNVLLAAGFAGPSWTLFTDALARYGVAVLKAWIGTGSIFARCMKLGLPAGRRITLAQREVVDLATITVAVAIGVFQTRVLPQRRWDPDRGASLKTFFIGQCLLSFPREYGKWLKDNHELGVVASVPEFADRGPGTDPVDLVEARSLVLRFASSGVRQHKVARVLALETAGFSQQEISTELGMTVGAIESLLFRHRRSLGA